MKTYSDLVFSLSLIVLSFVLVVVTIPNVWSAPKPDADKENVVIYVQDGDTLVPVESQEIYIEYQGALYAVSAASFPPSLLQLFPRVRREQGLGPADFDYKAQRPLDFEF